MIPHHRSFTKVFAKGRTFQSFNSHWNIQVPNQPRCICMSSMSLFQLQLGTLRISKATARSRCAPRKTLEHYACDRWQAILHLQIQMQQVAKARVSYQFAWPEELNTSCSVHGKEPPTRCFYIGVLPRTGL